MMENSGHCITATTRSTSDTLHPGPDDSIASVPIINQHQSTEAEDVLTVIAMSFDHSYIVVAACYSINDGTILVLIAAVRAPTALSQVQCYQCSMSRCP